jgi:hypothetical protein
MNLKPLFLLMLLVLLPGCDSGTEMAREGRELAREALDDIKRRVGEATQEEAPETQARQEEAPVKGPRIALKGVDITFNGRPLEMGAPIEAWTAVMGENPRPWIRGNIFMDIFYYDDLGVGIGMRSDNEKIPNRLTVILNRKPRDEYNPNMGLVPGVSTTRELFQGRLEIEGLVIHQDTTVREINKALRKAGHMSMYCKQGINLCSTTILTGDRPEDKRVQIYVDTDSRKYDGTIYGFDFHTGAL